MLFRSEQLENEQQPELGNPDRGLELDLATMEAESDRQEESISKSLNVDSRQLEMEKQLDLGEEHEYQVVTITISHLFAINHLLCTQR